MKKIIYSLLITAAAFFPGCTPDPKPGERRFLLDSFTSVVFEPGFNGAFEIVKGIEFAVNIQCGDESWLDQFHFSGGLDGSLYIYHTGISEIDWSMVHVTVFTPVPITPPPGSGNACINLDKLDHCTAVINDSFFTWSCNLKNLQLDIDLDNDFHFFSYSGPELDNLCVHKTGNGDFPGLQLIKARNVAVKCSGGDLVVWASEAVYINNSGSGVIRYGGNPLQVTIINTGTGYVEPL